MTNDDKPSFIPGHLVVANSISSGENALTFDGTTNSILAQAKSGKPIAIGTSDVDPVPIWPQTAAIFKAAPHPNAVCLARGRSVYNQRTSFKRMLP